MKLLEITITCMDSGSPILTISQNFNISVEDVNESPTSIHIVNKKGSISSFDEDQPKVYENLPIDTIVGTIQAIDQDNVTDLLFQLLNNPNGAFRLDDKVTCQNVLDANGINFFSLAFYITTNQFHSISILLILSFGCIFRCMVL